MEDQVIVSKAKYDNLEDLKFNLLKKTPSALHIMCSDYERYYILEENEVIKRLAKGIKYLEEELKEQKEMRHESIQQKLQLENRGFWSRVFNK